MKTVNKSEVMGILREVKKELGRVGGEIDRVNIKGFEYVGDNQIENTELKIEGNLKKAVEEYLGEKVSKYFMYEGIQIEFCEEEELQVYCKFKAITEYDTTEGWINVANLKVS